MPSAASPQAEESCSSKSLSKSLSKSEQATKALAAISISISIGGVNATALQEFDALAKTSPIKDL
jgi:hypothetical protein